MGGQKSVIGLTVVNGSSRKFSDHDRVHNEQRENGHERQYSAAEHYRELDFEPSIDAVNIGAAVDADHLRIY